MPNARVLNEKKQIVDKLSDKLRSQAGVLVNYKGINVIEDTELRVKLRQANVDYSVVKNSLMRFAIKNVGFDELDPVLVGTTSLAISNDDPIAPARIIKEYSDKLNDRFEIKAGFMDGKILSASEVVALAGIPPLPILQAQLLGTMLAPIASLAVVLNAIAEKGGAPADDAAEAPAEAAAEAPAEAIAEAPAEAAAEAPAEAAAEAPAEAAAEAPAEAAPEAPAEAAPEAPAKPTAKTKAKAAEKAPADDSTQE